MKRYVNRSRTQAAITYEKDGELITQYLRRGQVFEADIDVKSIRGEVEVTEVDKTKPKAKSSK